MKTTNKLKFLIGAVAALIFTQTFISCKPEKKENLGDYEKGIFILNEGGFGHGTAEITYHNPNNKKTQQGIFNIVNNRPLGDIGQSITFYDNKYYIVVNNSNKIEVVDIDFKSIAAFENIEMPRYAEFVAGKCYLTSWSNGGQVIVLSPSNGSILDRISVGQGAEKMQVVDNKLYVANSGGFGHASTISVINTSTGQIDTTITVGDNPNSFAIDKNKNLWTLLGGKYNDNWSEVTGAGLVKIDPSTNKILSTTDFGVSSGTASSLCSDGDNLYYLYNGGVKKIGIGNIETPTENFITGFYYKLFYNSGKLYVTDAADYQSDGKVYSFNAATGVAIDTIPAGIIPTHILFRQ